VSRYILLEGVSLEIYTTSFGRDVKLSGPGALVSVYCTAAISGYVISHPAALLVVSLIEVQTRVKQLLGSVKS